MKHMLTSLLNLDRTTKRFILVLVDVILITACFSFAMVLRFENTAFVNSRALWLAFVPVVPVTIIAYRQLGLYRSILRYITEHSFRAISIGAGVSVITLLVLTHLFSAPIPFSVNVIFGVLLILLTGGSRLIVRNVLRRPEKSDRLAVAIYGAGKAGRQLRNALFHGPEYEPLAYIDDDPSLQNTLIDGQRVYSPTDIKGLASEFNLGAILLALPSISRSRRREIIQAIEPIGLEIKTIPGMADIISGRTNLSELRPVTPEDLLGREPVPPNEELMERNITGKVVLVSGAGGSVGSELCRQVIKQNPQTLILFEISEFALYSITSELRETLAHQGKESISIEPILGSVQNAGRVNAVLSAFNVQTIYHAAAYKHVVLVEENVVDGIINNVFGTKVIADAAVTHGVENFTLISTDKAVRPTNFMGASKRIAELICQATAANESDTTFSMVRFGNVLGSSGSVIPRFESQIKSGGPVTVTHREITRYFMTIPEASQLVIQASAMAKGGDVFVLDMGDPVKILDLAHTMIRLHGLEPYIVESLSQINSNSGDIAIQIVGLKKGEKLYEELLIGSNASGTDHPRIMTASEVALTMEQLNDHLFRLKEACERYDIETISKIFREAPLAYQPTAREVHDLTWNASRQHRLKKGPALRVVE